MADDKKNIPDARKVDEPPKPGKTEPVKTAPTVQDQTAPAKAEAPKDKDAPAPSKEGMQPGKDEKQTTIPGMGDPAPAGKVVDFTTARDGATKGKPPEKAAAPDKDKQADKAKDAAKPRRGRPAKADKAAPDKAKPQPRDKMSQSKPPAGKGAPTTAEAPAATEQPPAPRDAARGAKEEIVYLNLSELHPFKNHPFGVRDDAEMQGLVESVKAAGVNQPALVRPREGGGYEIIAGHRRQRASELAGFVNMPCIVRNMTDDEAILAMTDDNLRHREKILPMERAQSLKMQVEAIKHQGARPGEDDRDAGKRSTQVVGDRNGMNYKQVQRYIRLTELVPDLQKMVDEKQLSFTPAVEISFIRPKHQKYIAVAIVNNPTSNGASATKQALRFSVKCMSVGYIFPNTSRGTTRTPSKGYLSEAEKYGVLPMFFLELSSGLRRGELLALRWDDLNMKDRILTVSKQVTRIDGELVVTEPKTKNSVRKVALSQQAVDLLVREHEQHPDNPIMFPSPRTGGYWSPDAVSRINRKLLAKAGIEEHVRFHDLRHTFATMALSSGVDVKTLSSMLGHFSAGFTLDTYTHITNEMQRGAAEKIGGFMETATAKLEPEPPDPPEESRCKVIPFERVG